MKTMNSFLRMALGCLFVSFAMCNTSCDSEESVIPEKPTPVNPENVDSNVDFEIKNENGAGEGTPSSPAQVFSDTLNMVISQKSVIKDTQGRVLFECEPKAKVNISSQSDTIFVSDKNQLMQVESKVDVKTSQSGTSPVLKKTLQTFNLGEQKIQFDLQNEVFYYVTEDKQKIEMPYPLLHNAKSGKYVAEEMVTRSEYRVVPAAVEIEAIASSRATKTDTTMYNVKAKFNLEVEAKNVKNTKKQPLEFVVNYVGAVIDATHIPDPDIDSGNVVYSTEIKGADGTGSLTSPIQVNGKKTTQVIFNQLSSFSDSGDKVFECNPKASIELYAQLDTVRVTNKDLLFEVTKNAEEKVSQSGENPIQNLKTQIFKFGGNQSINVKTAYEVCKYMTNAQQNIDMPCILLNGAKLGSSASKENTDVSEIVTIKEITTTRASVTDSTLYSVKVKCSLQYETVNTKKAESKTLDFEVNYMAVVSTTTEYPDPEPDSGDVEVSTEFQGGKGNGSVSAPFVVNGNSASVTLSQKSSFTDFDGSIFKCEPKATATISVPFDTLYVKDASELTYVNPKATAKTSVKGKNPTTKTTTVIYQISGGKTLDFGLDYESYNYTMKSGKTIEMAHYKWDTPNFGKASAMTLKNVQKTRAIVRNREVYNIVATFGLNAESVNTQNAKKQEMNFEVHYTGVVESEINVPDPEPDPDRNEVEFTTSSNGVGGNGSANSPFVVNGKSASITFAQKSVIKDTEGNVVYKCEPKATATINVPFDTLFVKDASELTYVNTNASVKSSDSGKNPITQKTSVIYKISGGKTLDFGLAYDVYNYTTESNKTIAAAYYKLNTLNFGNATSNEILDSRATPLVLKDIQMTRANSTNRKVYNIKATFGLVLEKMNTLNARNETLNLEVNYVGVVETEVSEPEFIKAEYRRDYEWVEPHHNMHLMHVAKVYRDRYYSNGDVKTDTFVDNGHPNISGLGLFPEGSGYLYVEEKEKPDSVRYSEVTEILNDSVCISKRTTYVPNLASVKYVEEDLGNNGVKIEELDRYTPSKIYNDETGWYAMSIKYNKRVIFKYGYANIAIMDLQPMFANQYLKIDGRIINFADWAPKHNWSLNKEDIPASGSNGPGMKYTYECHTTFMGRNFILRAEVSFIQKK